MLFLSLTKPATNFHFQIAAVLNLCRHVMIFTSFFFFLIMEEQSKMCYNGVGDTVRVGLGILCKTRHIVH